MKYNVQVDLVYLIFNIESLFNNNFLEYKEMIMGYLLELIIKDMI